MGYQFEHSWKHERERLALLERGDVGTIACFEDIGVDEGWACLEVGAGAGSIARWLAARVGPSGRVVATDLEIGFLEKIAAPNLEVRRHDILADPLEKETFDLVHARKVLEHLPAHERALASMVDATRPGGAVVLEDADLVSLRHVTTSDPALFWKGYTAFVDQMGAGGYQPELGLHLTDHLRAAGMEGVQVRGSCGEWTGGGEQPSVFLLTMQKMRDGMIAAGRLEADEADRFFELVQSPDFRAITAIHFIAWGRKP